MKNLLYFTLMSIFAVATFTSCSSDKSNAEEFDWVIDKFDDVKIIRYQVPGFAELPLQQKQLIYYLSEAALCGRDIMFDQNFKYNLAIRRTLEGVYNNHKGERESAEWLAFEKYLKKVWFANGIHHHYSGDKFIPEFSQEYFIQLVKGVPADKLPTELGSVEELLSTLTPIIFDPTLYAVKINQKEGEDLLQTSAMNYYEGLTQAEAEAFYNGITDANDPTPISYGLNSKLVKENGKAVEKVYKVGGMYGPAIEQIVFWLEKAAGVADATQRPIIEKLIEYYRTGDLEAFDAFNILWVQDTESNIDFVNGFTENYGDPLGRKGAWEGIVNYRDEKATERTRIISANAQWFEDHSPIDPKFRKPEVKGVSAKVINNAILAGDAYPATPIGINLPNADWIRRDYGSKSVTIQNITNAYAEAAKGNGSNEEFVLREEDRERMAQWGALADNLHTDLHECLGHGSGQLAPGVKGDELKQYSSTLEEARADLFSLYFMADPKMIELGIVPNEDVYKALYSSNILNGLMTQLSRIEPGKNIEEAHMRDRKLIAEWCYEHGKADNVIEYVKKDGKTYVVVNDFEALRGLFGELLREVQRIKSEGDFEAGKALVERYGVVVEPELHAEVLERYNALGIQPYGGFINPTYTPVTDKDGNITDVEVSYTQSYWEQMLDYSQNYSFLPTLN